MEKSLENDPDEEWPEISKTDSFTVLTAFPGARKREW